MVEVINTSQVGGECLVEGPPIGSTLSVGREIPENFGIKEESSHRPLCWVSLSTCYNRVDRQHAKFSHGSPGFGVGSGLGN